MWLTGYHRKNEHLLRCPVIVLLTFHALAFFLNKGAKLLYSLLGQCLSPIALTDFALRSDVETPPLLGAFLNSSASFLSSALDHFAIVDLELSILCEIEMLKKSFLFVFGSIVSSLVISHHALTLVLVFYLVAINGILATFCRIARLFCFNKNFGFEFFFHI